jgi:CDP-glucose 4,6-dehydratase
MHFLITGHTGFKGSWLTLLLKQRGHTVSGLALDPIVGSLFERASVAHELEEDFRLDIRDAAATRDAISMSQANVLIHMAAQPLVRESYRNPRYTYETNVNGTLNVLDALGSANSLRAALVITTDKVYRNDGRMTGYGESDALGGADPYSTSKAMADLLTQSWMRTAQLPVSIARAGNVIGGGDICSERLLPDLILAHEAGTVATLRNPNAVRPWQHVLDCLDGYLTIVSALCAGAPSDAWNIGPVDASPLTVGEVAAFVTAQLGAAPHRTVRDNSLHEAQLLSLDVSKAQQQLGWKPRLSVQDAIRWTTDWHLATHPNAHNADEITRAQVRNFEALRPS